MQEARGQTNWKFLAEIIGVVCVAGAVGAWLYFTWQARINDKGAEESTNASTANVKLFNGNNIPAKNSGGSAEVDMANVASQPSSSASTASSASSSSTTSQVATTNETNSVGSNVDYTGYGDSGQLVCSDCISEEKIIAVSRYGGNISTLDIQNSGGDKYISFINADLDTHTDNISAVALGFISGNWVSVNTLNGTQLMLKISPVSIGTTGTIIINSGDGKEFRFIINVT